MISFFVAPATRLVSGDGRFYRFASMVPSETLGQTVWSSRVDSGVARLLLEAVGARVANGRVQASFVAAVDDARLGCGSSARATPLTLDVTTVTLLHLEQ